MVIDEQTDIKNKLVEQQVQASNSAPSPAQPTMNTTSTPQPQPFQATNTQTTQPNQPAVDPRMEAIQGMLKGGADAQKQSQEALLAQARDKQIAELKKAMDDAVADGEISVREAEKQFNENKSEIEKQAYNESGANKLNAENRGIQNSQQMSAMEADADMRKKTVLSKTMTERDMRVNNVRDRLNAIKNKGATDIASANSSYDQGVIASNAGIDAQMFDNMFKLNQEQYQAERDQGYNLDNMSKQNEYDMGKLNQQQLNVLEQMAKAQGYDLTKMDVQQKNELLKMAKGQGYDLEKMKVQQGYDVTKLNTQQKHQLEQMAKAYGYDLGKMSKQQQYQLAQMAESYGYDMNMQNDAQSHDSYQQERSRTHQINMFGMEQNAKLDEYDLALEREMKSYDSGTTEGKLRINQLKSAKDALITEKMTSVIGELMGESFIQKYGDGMSPEEMQAWLDNPTNLNNLNSKADSLPEDKKGFLKGMLNNFKFGGVVGVGAMSRAYEEYKGLFFSTP